MVTTMFPSLLCTLFTVSILSAPVAAAQAKYTYNITVLEKPPTPVISLGLPVGAGHSPCNFTFNPALLQKRPPQLNSSILIVRASKCPAEYGGEEDHLLFAYCNEGEPSVPLSP